MNKESPLYIILFMLVICIVFSGAISIVYYSTIDMLKENETLHRNRTIARAFMLDVPGDKPDDYMKAIDKTVEKIDYEIDGRKINTFRNRNSGDIGFIFTGRGFWDTISGIIVFNPDISIIRNVQILEQKETPGLGARIEERVYTDQFKELIIRWGNPADKRIMSSGSGPGQDNRIDAITGATQTSIAMISILNKEIDIFKSTYNKMAE